MECKEVPWSDSVIQENYCIEDSGWPLKDLAYECKINLLTGRTHQVRAQLAACGAPIVGDSMYMPAAMAEMANLGLTHLENTRSTLVSVIMKWLSQSGLLRSGNSQVLPLVCKHVRFHGMMVSSFMKPDLPGGEP